MSIDIKQKMMQCFAYITTVYFSDKRYWDYLHFITTSFIQL